MILKLLQYIDSLPCEKLEGICDGKFCLPSSVRNNNYDYYCYYYFVCGTFNPG